MTLTGVPSLYMLGALSVELVITPILCLWQWRVARLYLVPRKEPDRRRTPPPKPSAPVPEAPAPRPAPTAVVPEDLPEPIPAAEPRAAPIEPARPGDAPKG